eukprot:gb/GEZN01014632.1/.p1 GENE.gb/GEZN01014632.1/~~gb/GEZN01014632.1/.p1  ORF type:complete len:123 (-),score=21.77 gb/GEZN01014632.1/:514-882(-)
MILRTRAATERLATLLDDNLDEKVFLAFDMKAAEGILQALPIEVVRKIGTGYHLCTNISDEFVGLRSQLEEAEKRAKAATARAEEATAEAQAANASLAVCHKALKYIEKKAKEVTGKRRRGQ